MKRFETPPILQSSRNILYIVSYLHPENVSCDDRALSALTLEHEGIHVIGRERHG